MGKMFSLFISEPQVECNKKIKKICHRHFNKMVVATLSFQRIHEKDFRYSWLGLHRCQLLSAYEQIVSVLTAFLEFS